MMRIPFYQVDAFTSQPFSGNPAGICLLNDEPLLDEQLLAIAAENNLAETAFLWPLAEGYRLRWFTPTVEVPLCGHATLASAHVLWESGRVPRQSTIRFQTLSGELTATAQSEGWIELDFPARYGKPTTLPTEVQRALRLSPIAVVAMEDRYLVEVATESEVRNLKPDFSSMTHNVIVTSRAEADSPFDFVSRFFAPASGVPEDPVTGSAHCCLATYWADQLGKTALLAYQASPRGGVIKVKLLGDRVRLAGQAVTLIEGVFRLPL